MELLIVGVTALLALTTWLLYRLVTALEAKS